MKIKKILMLMPVVAALAGCSQDEVAHEQPQTGGDYEAAYVSLNVKTPVGLAKRSSSEEGATTDEDAIRKLYAVTFDKNDNIIAYRETPVAQLLDISTSGYSGTKPKAFCVSSHARGLLLIANPGAQLTQLLTTVQEGTSFNVLNAAIISTTRVDEIIDNQAKTKGFTMINSGNRLVANDEDATPNSTLCLIDIKDKMQVVGPGDGQHGTPGEAITEAETANKRIKVAIERLAAKVFLKEKESGVTVEGNASFDFTGWVLDALNTKFYPWAKKVDTGTNLDPEGSYIDNFYTVDPNYTNNTGIVYNKITEYTPQVTWLANAASGYCIENTLKAASQLFKNATRVVIKSLYYPDDTWAGDWFSYGGIDYKDFAALKAAYKVATNTHLQEACDKMFDKVKAFLQANGNPVGDLTDFNDLTTAHLDKVVNSDDEPIGGEVLKEDGCVRWHQKGLTYYWYEIRHDDGITDPMAFAKYGVVRNNYYSLTLNSVKKAGTPWYPSVDPNGGEKDPSPEDPIDEMEGYLGVTVEVKPWIKWEHNIEL